MGNHAGSSPVARTRVMYITVSKLQRTSLFLRGCIVDPNALAGVYGYGRGRQRKTLRDGHGADYVVVNCQVLLQYAVDLLGLVDLDVVDELVDHRLRELACAGVLPDGG